MDNVIFELFKSWMEKEGNVNTNENILSWVKERNENVFVDIKKIKPDLKEGFWYYDEKCGEILNRNKSFFSIKGAEIYENDKLTCTQPILIQNEIGYLGIICKKINGVINFLMQAKIEPGNVNKIQISPTIQATKSNFTQRHGGNRPPYVDYFENSKKYNIIVDQLQSEQSSRFLKKRNRNIIILLSENENIQVLPSHKWMTLGQIKHLMKIDNLVNMDARTVLSCIPFYMLSADKLSTVMGKVKDEYLCNSLVSKNSQDIQRIYNYINDYKMYDETKVCTVPLMTLKNWHMNETEFACDKPYNFKVVFCDIEIDGREVKRWNQPLFEAIGMAHFGIFTCVTNSERKFLVKCRNEFGCFDGIEIGPTVQKEAISESEFDEIENKFYDYYNSRRNILYDVILSEEGGRFYHEQNRNTIIQLDEEIDDLPPGYFWTTYKVLNTLVQVNNCLNIQLRNLLSLLEV